MAAAHRPWCRGALRMGLALVLLAAVQSARAADRVPEAGAWGQCGGANNCPKADRCGDEPWAGVLSCPSGFTCMRVDVFFWQCRPTGSKAPLGSSPQAGVKGDATQDGAAVPRSEPGAAAPYQQCGGTIVTGGRCPEGGCHDNVWKPCPVGFTCQRENEYFYSCKPGGKGTTAAFVAAVKAQQRDQGEAGARDKGAAPGDRPASPAESQQQGAEPKRQEGQEAQPEQPEQQQEQPKAKPQPEGQPGASPAAQRPEQERPKEPDSAAASPEPAGKDKDAAKASPEPEPAVVELSPEPRPAEPASPEPEQPADASPEPGPEASPEPGLEASPEPGLEADNATDTLSANQTASRSIMQPIPVAQQQVDLGLEFAGVSPQEFEKAYANGTVAAVSEVSGIAPDSIRASLAPAGGRRRLLEAGTRAAYAITTPDATATTRSLETAAQNGGLYEALAKHGVNLRPSISINGKPVSAGGAADGGGWPQWKKIVVGVVVGVGGFLLLLLAAGLCWLCARRRRSKRQQQQPQLAKGAAADAGFNGTAAADTGMHDKKDQLDGSTAAHGARVSDADAAAVLDQQADGVRDVPPPTTFDSAAAAGAAAAAHLPVAAVGGAAVAGGAAAAAAAAASDSDSDDPAQDAAARQVAAVRSMRWSSGDPNDAHDSSDTRDAKSKPPWRPPSARYDIPPLAPPEHFPRSFNPEDGSSGRAPTMYPPAARTTVPPVRTGAAVAAAAAAAGAAGAGAAAAAGHSSELPPTPPSGVVSPARSPTAGLSSDAFATPRSNASFTSAHSGASDGSFKSVRSNLASEAGSFKSAHSRATTAVSSASRLSASLSAREFPRAFVPQVDSGDSSSSTEGNAR